MKAVGCRNHSLSILIIMLHPEPISKRSNVQSTSQATGEVSTSSVRNYMFYVIYDACYNVV